MNNKRYTGYMCRTALETDLGMCPDRPRPVEVYGTVEALKAGKMCWEDCGIVEVEIVEIQEVKEVKETKND